MTNTTFKALTDVCGILLKAGWGDSMGRMDGDTGIDGVGTDRAMEALHRECERLRCANDQLQDERDKLEAERSEWQAGQPNIIAALEAQIDSCLKCIAHQEDNCEQLRADRDEWKAQCDQARSERRAAWEQLDKFKTDDVIDRLELAEADYLRAVEVIKGLTSLL